MWAITQVLISSVTLDEIGTKSVDAAVLREIVEFNESEEWNNKVATFELIQKSLTIP